MSQASKRPQYQFFAAGAPPEAARAAAIMIHGRGASATDILQLAREFPQSGFAFLAPQAPLGTWYPARFMEPIERNEPGITWAMETIDEAIQHLNSAGIATQQIVLIGFSQGACLALEYAARHAQRFGGVAGLSGGLIGPDGTPRDYPGSLAGTPVFLGCSDVDFHIPVHRVHEAAEVFERMGAEVTERIYPGMGHTVNGDEITYLQALLQTLGKDGA